MTDRERRLRRVEEAYAAIARETARRIGIARARRTGMAAAHAEMRDALASLPQLQDVLGYGRQLERMAAEAARQERDLALLIEAGAASLLRQKAARRLLDAAEAGMVKRQQKQFIDELTMLAAGASLPQDDGR